MPEHRERVDKRTSAEINRRVMIPLLTDLGARYLLKPYLGAIQRDEEKSIKWGLGHHHKKGHRSTVEYQGIHYRDGEMIEGKTRKIEVDRQVDWSVKHDNRLTQNERDEGNDAVVLRRNLQQDPHVQQALT